MIFYNCIFDLSFVFQIEVKSLKDGHYGKVLFLKVCQTKDSPTDEGKKMQYFGFADDTACAKALSFVTGGPHIIIFTYIFVNVCAPQIVNMKSIYVTVSA